MCEESCKFVLKCTENPRVKHIWSCGFVYVQMLQLLLYFLSAKVETIKDITFILAYLPWDIIELFNGEHRAEVIVHCVGHVIIGGDNNSSRVVSGPMLTLAILLLLYIRGESFGIVFTNSCND